MIRVAETTPEEKAMILYNHLRGGNQDKAFKSEVKGFLPSVISERHLLPEVARRFGLKTFTTKLGKNQAGVASGNLREDEIAKVVERVRHVAIENLDYRFSEGRYRQLLSEEQYLALCQELIESFREKGEPRLENLVESLDEDTDAQEHFREFTGMINFLRSVFDLSEEDEELCDGFDCKISDEISSAEEKQKARDSTPKDDFDVRDVEIEGGISLEMFDDVDE